MDSDDEGSDGSREFNTRRHSWTSVDGYDEDTDKDHNDRGDAFSPSSTYSSASQASLGTNRRGSESDGLYSDDDDYFDLDGDGDDECHHDGFLKSEDEAAKDRDDGDERCTKLSTDLKEIPRNFSPSHVVGSKRTCDGQMKSSQETMEEMFLQACVDGNIPSVIGHLGKVDLNSKLASHNIECDIRGATPLMIASWYGRNEVVDLLLQEENVDVNTANDFGETALIFASHHGHDKVVALLLRHREIDVNASDKDGQTALQAAGDNESVVNLLIRRQGLIRRQDLRVGLTKVEERFEKIESESCELALAPGPQHGLVFDPLQVPVPRNDVENPGNTHFYYPGQLLVRNVTEEKRKYEKAKEDLSAYLEAKKRFGPPP